MSTTFLTILLGTANPIPCQRAEPALVAMAMLMPMTSPCMLTRAPPLLPGLIIAVVWKWSSTVALSIRRPRALMMPAETVLSRSSGCPIASTCSAMRVLSLSPQRAGVNLTSPGSIFNTARSTSGASETTLTSLPRKREPSYRRTSRSRRASLPPMTCKLVTMWP
ncbi:MAG: hypothetical protein BWZ10_02939 [candidate division BRC1 bacterium ADurb.BinA364]|nr:MAG: hypothetical protein BWZ10_02939 [candidate division BRC1 bacterium ADurb.BinA364]